jgi:hypothetical protein
LFQILNLKRNHIGSFNFKTKSELLSAVEEYFEDPADLVGYMQGIYDIGFLAGRLISEYFIRSDIEPLAEKGVAAKQAQEARTKGSSKAASEKRHLRIHSMLKNMERLSKENPAFYRLPITHLADLAISDAKEENQKLWGQGRGQRDEYLDELKSDIRYQARFQQLLIKRA